MVLGFQCWTDIWGFVGTLHIAQLGLGLDLWLIHGTGNLNLSWSLGHSVRNIRSMNMCNSIRQISSECTQSSADGASILKRRVNERGRFIHPILTPANKDTKRYKKHSLALTLTTHQPRTLIHSLTNERTSQHSSKPSIMSGDPRATYIITK